MGDVYIRIPVTCPICRIEHLSAFRVESVLDGLDNAAPIRLTASCHDTAWYATPAEVDRIRQHVAEAIDFSSRATPWIIVGSESSSR